MLTIKIFLIVKLKNVKLLNNIVADALANNQSKNNKNNYFDNFKKIKKLYK